MRFLICCVSISQFSMTFFQLRDTTADLQTSSKVLSKMLHRILQNRVVLFLVAFIVVAVIVGLIVYSLMPSTKTPATDSV